MPSESTATVGPKTAELAGRVAVVTGASSGLGARFGRVLHAAGATVVLAARRADRLDELADELGERATSHQCDVGDQDQREALVAQTIARHGRIDVLVNNAGIGRPGPAEDEPIEVFRDVFEVNVTAPFHLAQLAGRHMLSRQSGAIINIASIFGVVASAPLNQASYCASKGAVVNLTRELGAQWASRGVRVNCIAPGWFETEMTADMWNDASSRRFVERNTPAGRPGSADELDGVLLLLAGDGATYINGQTITVDGGWTAR